MVKRAVINNIEIVKAYGECDLCSVQLLKDTMTKVIEEGHKKLIVDIRDLQHLDNSGIAAILWARHKIEENKGTLVTVGLGDKCGRMRRSVGELLDIASSVKEALIMINKGRLSYRHP